MSENWNARSLHYSPDVPPVERPDLADFGAIREHPAHPAHAEQYEFGKTTAIYRAISTDDDPKCAWAIIATTWRGTYSLRMVDENEHPLTARELEYRCEQFGAGSEYNVPKWYKLTAVGSTAEATATLFAWKLRTLPVVVLHSDGWLYLGYTGPAGGDGADEWAIGLAYVLLGFTPSLWLDLPYTGRDGQDPREFAAELFGRSDAVRKVAMAWAYGARKRASLLHERAVLTAALAQAAPVQR